MEAKDTVTYECICGGYDFEPFESAYSEEICHCYECDAYNTGKRDQAEIAFKAGRKEVVEWVDEQSFYHTSAKFVMDAAAWQAKLKEWGI